MQQKPTTISKTEHRILLLVSFVVFAFFASGFVVEFASQYNQAPLPAGISFGPRLPQYPAGLHLITLFIFVSFIRPKRLIIPTILTLTYLTVLLVSIPVRVNSRINERASHEPPTVSSYISDVLTIFEFWDFIGALFICTILSILAAVHARHKSRLD
jgi:hypothetical protein